MLIPNTTSCFLIPRIHYNKHNRELVADVVFTSNDKIPVIIKNMQIRHVLDKSSNIVNRKKQLTGILIVSNGYIPDVQDRLVVDNSTFIIEDLAPANNSRLALDSAKYSIIASS